ncbi:GM26678 [Drosophila sechellia]|uniref:GM26678 n=1 Tax=Drosophila sechellia TaxID=7238 RepID=B4IPD1_DROSE|nr:GM26678 [Drosophila sechellia]
MGKSWLYSLKKDDFPAIATALGIKLEGLVEEMRKTLSEFIDQTADEPESVAIIEAMEKEYGRRPAVEVKVTGVEGLVRSLDFASMAEASGSRSERQEVGQERRDSCRERTERREASRDRLRFRYDGNEKPLEFLEQVEWSAMTYGLDINQIPRAMPELLTGRALKWFIANNKFWETWVEFIQSFQEFFLPRGFMTKLAEQGQEKEQRHGENFKDYMVDMQTLMRPLGMSQKETLARIRENSTPALRMFIRPYECRHLDALMDLADEFEELDTQRERFDLERNNRARHQREFPRGDQNAVCRRCQDDTAGPSRNINNRREPDPVRRGFVPSPAQACHRCGGQGHWSQECRNRPINFCWICGRIGPRTSECCHRSGNAMRPQPQMGNQGSQDAAPQN